MVFELGNSFLTFDDDTEEKLTMWEVRKSVGSGPGENRGVSQNLDRGKYSEEQSAFRKNLKKLDLVVKGPFEKSP